MDLLPCSPTDQRPTQEIGAFELLIRPTCKFTIDLLSEKERSLGLVRSIEITTANVHDAQELDAIQPEAPGDTHGDSAYSGSGPDGVIRGRGDTPRVVHTDTWGGPDALARLRAGGAEIDPAELAHFWPPQHARIVPNGAWFLSWPQDETVETPAN